ncbi:hypothetical protein MKW92_000293 [Papaver armeniacum]|nr:hypothetical protein MKW92_000293 [Papaver armeniacum]
MQQMISDFTAIHIVASLILCLLLLNGFSYSVEATRKINGCRTDLDCINHCRSKGYSDDYCEPWIKMNRRRFICCCLY